MRTFAEDILLLQLTDDDELPSQPDRARWGVLDALHGARFGTASRGRLQGVHEPAVGASADAHAVDLEHRRADLPQTRRRSSTLRCCGANIDLSALAERLAESRVRRFSLCLQGPPGTGKSAFVRYLAERVGLEVVQKRASDLLSMWVGDTGFRRSPHR